MLQTRPHDEPPLSTRYIRDGIHATQTAWRWKHPRWTLSNEDIGIVENWVTKHVKEGTLPKRRNANRLFCLRLVDALVVVRRCMATLSDTRQNQKDDMWIRCISQHDSNHVFSNRYWSALWRPRDRTQHKAAAASTSAL